MKKTVLFIMLIIVYITSCSELSDKKTGKTEDSELTLMMRKMYAETEQIREAILNGNELPLKINHLAVLNSEATQPEKVNSSEYRIFAQEYLDRLSDLYDSDLRLKSYQKLIQSCVNCHSSLCPGPIVKINKLYLK